MNPLIIADKFTISEIKYNKGNINFILSLFFFIFFFVQSSDFTFTEEHSRKNNDSRVVVRVPSGESLSFPQQGDCSKYLHLNYAHIFIRLYNAAPHWICNELQLTWASVLWLFTMKKWFAILFLMPSHTSAVILGSSVISNLLLYTQSCCKVVHYFPVKVASNI